MCTFAALYPKAERMQRMNQTLIRFLIISLSLWPSLLQGQKHSLAKDLNPPPPPACGGAVGINLNEAGTFGAGPNLLAPIGTHPQSGYSSTNNLPLTAGSFTLANSTENWPTEFNSPNWISITDLSDAPGGYMMVVNGQADNVIIAEWEVDALCAGITYEFSASFINLLDSTEVADGLPEIEFLIDGQLLGSTGEIPQDEAWRSFGFTFMPDGSQTALRIALRQNSEGLIGNDFAIDNVLFRPCGPTMSLEELSPMPHCVDANIEVALGIGTGLSSPIIQWQVSQDEGLSWQNFGVPSTSNSLLIDQLPPALALRALVAADQEKITRPTCRYITNAIAFEYAPIENCPTTIIDTVLCAGQTVQIGSEIFHADGTFQVLLKDEVGADSLVQLNLVVNAPIQTQENIGLCPGDTYEGTTYLADTSFSTTHAAVNGCDSTHTINIVLFPAPNPQITGPASLCDGRPDRLITSGTFVEYEWSNGADGPSLPINAPGLYGLTVTDDMGCIGEASWEVLETRIKVGYQVSPPSCAAAVDGILHIDQIAGGSGNYEVRLDGKLLRESTVAVPSGIFELQVTDSQGCGTTEQITILPASPLALTVQDRYEIFSGQSIDLSFEANHTITAVQWTSIDSLSCSACESLTVSPTFTTRYHVFAEDDQGCTAEAEITVIVRQSFAYFAPNVFSPNDDGINDYFSIYGGPEIQQVEDFKIFNRWGTLLFSIDQLTLGAEIWDGSYQGKALPNGVYVYQGEMVGQNGKRQPIMGEFMLLR